MLRIDADTANNRADLRLYAQGWLGATGRSEQEVVGLIDAIDARADGSFIYLRKLREAHENRSLKLDKDAMPFGLNGLYDEWFTRQFPDLKAYRDRVAPAGADRRLDTPVPDAVLDEAMAETVPGWDEVASAAVLQLLGSLFERRGDGWAPFHKSVRDWLTDRDTKARHRVAETAGRSRLASLLWRHFVTAAVDPAASLSPFLLSEFPAQAARQTRATRAAWVMEASNWNPLQARCVATIIFFRERRFWAAMLAWCGLSRPARPRSGGNRAGGCECGLLSNGAMCCGCSAERPRPPTPTAATWALPGTSPMPNPTIRGGSGNCSRP